MSDEKEEPKKEEPGTEPKDPDEGGKYETTPVIERAREEREKLEAATKAQKEENDRTEQIMAKQALGGVTLGPEQPAQVSEEDKKKAGAKGFFKGTQLEKDIDKL